MIVEGYYGLKEGETDENRYFAEDYGDDLTATEIANDPAAKQEIITALLADPTFFDQVVARPEFIKRFVDSSVVNMRLNGYFLQSIIEDPELTKRLLSNSIFAEALAREAVLDPAFGVSTFTTVPTGSLQPFVDAFARSNDVRNAIRDRMEVVLEMVGLDDLVVSTAEVRENGDGTIEYFFDAGVARDNPEASIRVSLKVV
jgi:hypothetical protein